jgi:hypothetical protein
MFPPSGEISGVTAPAVALYLAVARRRPAESLELPTQPLDNSGYCVELGRRPAVVGEQSIEFSAGL